MQKLGRTLISPIASRAIMPLPKGKRKTRIERDKDREKESERERLAPIPYILRTSVLKLEARKVDDDYNV